MFNLPYERDINILCQRACDDWNLFCFCFVFFVFFLQVEAVVKIIPKDIIKKGKRVTEDMLNQLKWKGKGKRHNK